MEIKSGQIIATTTGQYSDYTLNDHLRAIKSFKTEDVIEEYKKSQSYKKSDWLSQPGRLYAWMIRKKYVESLSSAEVVEWWIDEDEISPPYDFGDNSESD